MLVNWNELRFRFTTCVYCLLLSSRLTIVLGSHSSHFLALCNSLGISTEMADNGDLGAVARRDTDQLAAVDALAGALVNAVRHSFEEAIVPGPSQSPCSGHMLPGGSSSTPQRKVTEYQRAAQKN